MERLVLSVVSLRRLKSIVSRCINVKFPSPVADSYRIKQFITLFQTIYTTSFFLLFGILHSEKIIIEFCCFCWDVSIKSGRMRSFILSLLAMFLLCGSTVISPTVIDGVNFIVAADGSGDFRTVQEAINAVPDFRKKETVIFIKDGRYKEKLILPVSKTKVKLVGESNSKTIITGDDHATKLNRFGEEMGTTGSSGFYVFGDDFTACNLTFENSAGLVGQAVAVRVSGDRIVFNNCRFLGFQDTLYPEKSGSRQYYYKCYIEGTVDFIFGWATAYFDECEIFCKDKGYVTAASTNEGVEYGFVFRNCRITGSAPEGSVFLGRPWRNYARSVYLNCFLDSVINPQGWNNWNKKEAEITSFYAEYKSYGPAANIEKRVNWSHQINQEESLLYTPEKVLCGSDGWCPQTNHCNY